MQLQELYQLLSLLEKFEKAVGFRAYPAWDSDKEILTVMAAPPDGEEGFWMTAFEYKQLDLINRLHGKKHNLVSVACGIQWNKEKQDWEQTPV